MQAPISFRYRCFLTLELVNDIISGRLFNSLFSLYTGEHTLPVILPYNLNLRLRLTKIAARLKFMDLGLSIGKRIYMLVPARITYC